jgi:hypothetical protein
LKAKLGDFVPSHLGLDQALEEGLWATSLAILLFESGLTRERDIWVLVVEKARTWLSGLANGAGIQVLEKMAREVQVIGQCRVPGGFCIGSCPT